MHTDPLSNLHIRQKSMTCKKMANFKNSNKLKFVYALLYVLLIVFLFTGINFLSIKYFGKLILGKSSKFVLSEKSLEILNKLKSNVEIFFILEKKEGYFNFDQVRDDIRHLVDKFLQAPCESRIDVEIVNAAESSKRYRGLCIKFGILPKNCVVISTNNKVKVFAIDELYKGKNGAAVAFVGENVISSALEDLCCNKKHVIYFTVGHCESEIESTSESDGLSSLKNLLNQRNYEARSLNIHDTKGIPDDADILAIIGAKTKLFGFEIEIIKDFIDFRDGKVIIGLESGFSIGLQELCNDYGIFVGKEVILPFNEKLAGYGENLILKRYSEHPINSKLIEFHVPVSFGGTCEVSTAKWVTDDDKFEVSELVQTDTNIISGDKKLQEHEIGKTVAVISEKKKLDHTKISKNGGKLLVIGNSDFISNSRINFIGNRLFWLGINDYLLKDESKDLNLEDIVLDEFRLAISASQFKKIIARGALLPIFAISLFLVVLFLRRK